MRLSFAWIDGKIGQKISCDDVGTIPRIGDLVSLQRSEENEIMCGKVTDLMHIYRFGENEGDEVETLLERGIIIMLVPDDKTEAADAPVYGDKVAVHCICGKEYEDELVHTSLLSDPPQYKAEGSNNCPDCGTRYVNITQSDTRSSIKRHIYTLGTPIVLA